ncbi:hypothetical protein L2E82_05948 [Cichorium intybus]|uniref:Uncharacterized protein n=1 Tax=Cichorium intybus TaxID=13427 RepID=A0ACB9H9T3_CICIN|nr:hypothetical protein L2E82_05948 [Cichorium intybus]
MMSRYLITISRSLIFKEQHLQNASEISTAIIFTITIGKEDSRVRVCQEGGGRRQWMWEEDGGNVGLLVLITRLEMTILYTLVARGSVLLAEFSGSSTNASTIARQILEKIPGNNDMNVSYSQDRYIFHVKRTYGLTILCMADDVAERRIPFTFLEDIHQRFVRTYGRAALIAQAYEMNDEFSRVLSQQMEYYSNDPNADRLNRLKGEMSQVRSVMIQNIDKVLERGDRLESLVDKTTNMQTNTFRFRKQTRRFRNTMWVAMVVVLLVIVYIVLAFVCKGFSLPACI